jgi:hypothetical protein
MQDAVQQLPHLKLCYTVKKRFAIFPFSDGMSLTKLSLAGNNFIVSSQGEFD